MRLTLLSLLALPLTLATDWAAASASAPDGVLQLNTETFNELTAPDREWGATIVLTAMPAGFKCAPCHDFDPIFRTVARSWRRKSKDVRDKHFFAELDFSAGQDVFQRLGLTSAPTVYYYPPAAGERKAAKTAAVNFDLNRAGLSIPPLHAWVKSTTPESFDIYIKKSPIPFLIAPLVVATILYAAYSARAILLPIMTSRIIWGVGTTMLCITFTSGYMWNKIKNAPYVQSGAGGRISWVAGGYQNQLGLESQVVGALYGVLALTIVVLSVFIPAQSSPTKQRVGTYLWLALLVVLFSLLIRLFKLKNGGYPFGLF
ncbi:hypothetical protein CcaverHIS002_0202420 [Cutaneotrichosporon cavernicola]|uniref:Dolichyl-diphosphooligosaccharide-protein glycotransferase n=1 Tax=Cutaneotrichosporon cavernicola TaxID=279322 RepID=A0AA48L1G5_9TREE|nr:uncharacterized protein CcaverHIS019_0202440 [Cutaneotrichosporon cavernicola]BEI81082.1 hypothetical protein CcaverHIS002_0202420 [Cutaneotrichosporon cavernicola]BEI88882.1 hypothetical protein CcaverHIS019_0202440 [Cutaneotrichosporon cavernicola]BEI96659.1 hypothetical protein CcaverHIS631_0202480 [Cutaneotrichosporon cavernicola]BEJ04430.1 hypothetical protein CcaverHIS641_0202470 [Cutaneotrichosporon cavernicola]